MSQREGSNQPTSRRETTTTTNVKAIQDYTNTASIRYKEFAVSNFNDLPVAPEFVDVLQDNVIKTVKQQLEKNKVPEDVAKLVCNMFDLGYYIAECYRSPETLTGDPQDRFNIEEVVLDTINLVAKLGGSFYGPIGANPPRAVAPEKATKKSK